MMSLKTCLRIDEMRFRYSEVTADVLDIPELVVSQGQFVSLIGASGSGKSSLLRLIAGLLQPTAGKIAFDAVVCGSEPAPKTGMVFQNANLVPWRTARENVRLPAELGPSPSNVSEKTLDSLFDLVGLQQQDTCKRAGELSGGMQMRVSLARAMVLQPSIMLMDEPFAALDDLLRMQLEEDVRKIHNERSLTTVLVTHNINEAVFMSDRVLVLGGEPSAIQADIDVTLPAERNRQLRSDPVFHRLVDNATDALHAAAGVQDLLSEGATQ